MDAVRIMVKAEFDCEHGNITIGEYQKILDPLHDVEPIVRCKDCILRGDEHKCVVAYLAKQKNLPLFLYDNRGEWFCADGKRE